MTTNSKPELCEVCGGTAEKPLYRRTPPRLGHNHFWHKWYESCVICEACTAPIHPQADKPRILTADDMRKLAGIHACRAAHSPLKNECGCFCGRHYGTTWEDVVIYDYPQLRIECKCKPSASRKVDSQADKYKRVAERLHKAADRVNGDLRIAEFERILLKEYPE